MTYGIIRDNFSTFWFVYKEPSKNPKNPGIKVSICLDTMLAHLKDQKKIERIRKPCLIIKIGSYHSADSYEHVRGPFVGKGGYKICHKIEGQKRVQLKTDIRNTNEWEMIKNEVLNQRSFAKVTSLCCPIIFAYCKPSFKTGIRYVILIAKAYDRHLHLWPLPPIDLHQKLILIAKAIEVAHFNNFILADLKGANVLISDDGELALTDMAALFHESSPPKRDVTTLAYASPESITFNYGKKHDIFSFALIIYIQAIGYLYPAKNIYSLHKEIDPEEFQKRYILEILNFRKQMIPKENPYYSLLQDMLRPNANSRPDIENVLKRLKKLTPEIIRRSQTRTEVK